MILDTFAFLFQSEGTDQVKKDVSDLRNENKKLVEENNNVGNSFQNLVGIIAPLVATYGALRSAMDFSREAESIGLLANASGISARSLSELGFVSAEFGGNINTASNAIRGLERQLMSLYRTGSGPLMQANLWYGVGISNDPEQMLKNVAKRFETLNRRQQFDLGKMLGLDDATIMSLQGGLKKFNDELERAKKYTFIDDKMVERSRELMRVNRENSAVWEGLKNIFLDFITPTIQFILETMRDVGEFLHEHKGLIAGIAVAVGAVTVALMPWAKILLAVKALFSPIGLMLTGIATLVALIGDDIEKYLSGQNSLIGKLFEAFPQLKIWIEQARAWFNELWEDVKKGAAWENIKEKATEFFTAFKEDISKLVAFFIESWGKISENITDTKQYFVNLYNEASKTLGDLAKVVSDELSEAWDDFVKNIQNTPQLISDAIEKIKNFFIEIWEAIKEISEGVSLGITDKVKMIVDFITPDFLKSEEDKKNDIRNVINTRNSDISTISNASSIFNSSNNNSTNDNSVSNNITNNFYPGSEDRGDIFERENFAQDFNRSLLGHFSRGNK